MGPLHDENKLQVDQKRTAKKEKIDNIIQFQNYSL